MVGGNSRTRLHMTKTKNYKKNKKRVTKQSYSL